MDWQWAYEKLWLGGCVARRSWPDALMFVEVGYAEEGGERLLVLHAAVGASIFVPSADDLTATDWDGA